MERRKCDVGFFLSDTATTEIYNLSLHDGSSDLPQSPPVYPASWSLLSRSLPFWVMTFRVSAVPGNAGPPMPELPMCSHYRDSCPFPNTHVPWIYLLALSCMSKQKYSTLCPYFEDDINLNFCLKKFCVLQVNLGNCVHKVVCVV